MDSWDPGAGYLEGRVEEYLDRRLGPQSWKLLRREKGTIPLFQEAKPLRHGRVYHLGVAAGAARPSTGYAFRAILETSAALAGKLSPILGLKEQPLPEAPVPSHAAPRPRFFDAVLSSC